MIFVLVENRNVGQGRRKKCGGEEEKSLSLSPHDPVSNVISIS